MRFAPGETGNSNGRPKKDVSRDALREAIRGQVPKIIEKLLKLALSDDGTTSVAAARTLLERALPPMRAESALIQLPELAAAQTVTEQAACVLRAIGEGQLAPDVGAQILNGVGRAARAKEMDELETRIAELESRK